MCYQNQSLLGDGSGDDGDGDHDGDGDDVDDFVGVELLLRKIGGCPLGRPILQYPPTLHYTQSYVWSCLSTFDTLIMAEVFYVYDRIWQIWIV